MTPEELEAERLRLQAEASTNPMMQTTNLMGQQAPQEDVNPLALAGLGGAAAFQGMFPFAGEAAANSRGTTLPQLMGSGNSQFTGANAGRLTQGTQIVPQTQLVPSGQPPAVRPTGVPTTPGTNVTPSNASAARNIKMAERVRQLNLPNAAKVGRAGLNLSRLGSLLSPAALYTAADLGTEYFTGRGISERFGEFGGELLGEALYGDGNLTAYSEEELAQIQKGPVAEQAAVPEEQAGSENLGLFSTGGYFNSPTGQPSEVAQPTQLDIFNSRVAAGEDANQVRIDLGVDANFGRKPFVPGPSVADVIIGKQARGPDATYAPEELNQITSIQGDDQANSAQFVQDYQAGQMGIAKSLQDFSNVDDLRAVEAQLAEKGIVRDLTTPFQQAAESLAPVNAMSSFTPRSTFTQADGRIMQEDEFGQQREITADQLRQFEGDMAQLGQPTEFTAPMGVDATRARLGGRTLNEYLNAPGGTEGVSGLRTDPQGRMIPGGFDTRADAYGQYEDEVSQAYQRQSERMQQRADQRDGTAGPRTYGDYTTSQLRGMVGGGDNLRAAQMRAEAGLNPVTGNREKTEAERSQSEQQGQLQNEVLQARLDSFKQTDPDKLSKAQAYAERLGLTGDSATAFIFSQMGTSMDDIFDLEGTGAGGGGGGAVPDSIAGLAAQYSGKTLTGPDGTKYKSDGTSWTKVQ